MKPRIYASILAYGLSLMSGNAAQAAPGTLAQQPLFLANNVAPNLFFLNDNSGSMTWEILTTNFEAGGRLTDDADTLEPAFVHKLCFTALNPPTVASTDGRQYGFVLQRLNSATPCDQTVAEEEWRARFHGINRTYYNPEIDYKPWAGTDENGDPLYDNASVTAAPFDPTDPDITINLLTDSAVLVNGERTYYDEPNWDTWCSNNVAAGSTCSGWRFYTWHDAIVDGGDGDGVIDADELEIHWVADLTTEKKQNFANWFTYHRSREHAAKYALSLAISQATQARIGYGAINGSFSIRIGDNTAAHRQDVLATLFGTVSNGSTPLRSKLKAVGEYYETGNLFGDSGDSPILSSTEGGACQANNVIMMTDGFYNGSSPDVGNVDGDNGAPYADNYSNTLADVAMHYYETDLAPGLSNAYPVTERDYTPEVDDAASHQHMNTHTVAFGLTGTIDPATVDINALDFSWPDPQTGTQDLSIPERIDDLFHAAVNGRGSYLSAADPDELVRGLLAQVREITDISPSAGAVSTSSSQLQAGSKIFFARLNPSDWSGQLLAHAINDNGGIVTTPDWDAAQALANEDETTREIITFNGSRGVPFVWNDGTCSNCISSAMNDLLTAGSTQTGIGEARLDYLRGKQDSSFNFRQREVLLGDIVNSSPVYVGAPASLYPDRAPFGSASKRYFSFWNSNKDRDPVVYVGANDGMLHGFDVSSGEEVLAYVPRAVFDNLHELTRPDYNHRYYVDQTPSVSDAYFAKQGSGDEDWRTVLVGGLGAGGRGLYALDVTNPDTFNESNADDLVLWEFTSTDDEDLGYTFSRPVIALTEEGRWAAIVGNGYNSSEDSTDPGTASLFILYLDADLSDGSWDIDDDYRKIDTGVGGVDFNENGLSSPAAVDSDGDGRVDRVYAGDLKGNMWVFDLSDANAANWDVAYGTAADPQPLFQATDHVDFPQPITAKPNIIRHPFHPTLSTNAPNLMVLFGTGQYLTLTDLDDTQKQSFYGVWDRGDSGLGRGNLQLQIIESGTDTRQEEVVIEARITTRNPVDYGGGTEYGWYIDLGPDTDSQGERVISNAVVIRNTVFFTTYIPNTVACSTGGSSTGGSSWFMFVDAASGGYPSDPVISINNDRLVDENDLVTLNEGDEATAPSGLKIQGTLGSPTLDLGQPTGTALINTGNEVNQITNLATDLGAGVRGKRLSWRELREQ